MKTNSSISLIKLKNFLTDEIAKANEDISVNDGHLAKIDILKEVRILEDEDDDYLTNQEQEINLDNATLGGRRQAMRDVLTHISIFQGETQ